MARPRKVIDPKQVEGLASIGCTLDEMALVLDCSKSVLSRRFSNAIKKGKAKMQSSLRRLQYDAARNGNVTMMIWLGKQYLGQRDKFEADTSDLGERPTKTPAELIAEMDRSVVGDRDNQ